MSITRRQLTLFPKGNIETIEYVRSTFNPVQAGLIAAHVTLCREDEIEQLDKVIRNIQLMKNGQPLRITFSSIERFDEGKGVMLQASEINDGFDQLRQQILMGLVENPRKHRPHITLMHPRNSTCTEVLFNQLRKFSFPVQLYFEKISLIEQKGEGRWSIHKEYPIVRE
jgi:2'-5' RNA ligase